LRRSLPLSLSKGSLPAEDVQRIFDSLVTSDRTTAFPDDMKPALLCTQRTQKER